jgi:hypothetical protein
MLDRLQLGPAMTLGCLAHVYLAGRSLMIALGIQAVPEGPAVQQPDQQGHDLRRVIWLAAVASVLAAAAVVISSDGVVDIGFASMKGATLLWQGQLPYGHMSDVFHGDTYPLLNYVVYMPAALLAPVRDGWDSTDGALWIGASALILTAVLAARALASGTDQRLRLLIAMLAFPPLLGVAASGANDLLVAAALLWAVIVFERPGWSAALLACGVWCKVAPVIALPTWISRFRGTQLRRALWAAAGVSLLVLAATAILGGSAGLGDMAQGLRFQFERSSSHSIWVLSGLHGLRLLAEACAVGLICLSVVLVRCDHQLARSPQRLCALMAVAMIAVQLASDYWSYSYLPWMLPLVLVALIGATTQAEAVPESGRASQRLYGRPAALPASAR